MASLAERRDGAAPRVSPAYCGDECRAGTRFAALRAPWGESTSKPWGALARTDAAYDRGSFARAAKDIRDDRKRLARLGWCIGCAGEVHATDCDPAAREVRCVNSGESCCACDPCATCTGRPCACVALATGEVRP